MSVPEVFLTWNDSRRSVSLCEVVGLPRVVHVPRLSGALRHVCGILASACFLLRHRPRLVWFQYSQGLGILLSAYRSLMPAGRVRLVADLHTKALRRDMPGLAGVPFRWLKRRSLESCACTLVTNGQNASFALHRYAIRSLVLPDPLPTPPPGPARFAESTEPEPLVFVCSFAADEPIGLLIEVARRQTSRDAVVVTGDPRRLDPIVREELESVAVLSGFLPEPDYWHLLHRARGIVVLSDEHACLPCGAYEAIAVGHTPVVADDAEARQVFGTAACYAPLTIEGVLSAVEAVVARRARREADGESAATFRERWRERWRSVREELAAGVSLPAVNSSNMDVTHAGS